MSRLQYVRDAVECEGFEYALRHYSSWDDVEDPIFQALKKAFVAAADGLEEYIYAHTTDEEEEDE
jgi:hypothetical protein